MANNERLSTPIIQSTEAVPEKFVRLSSFVRSAVAARGLRAPFVRHCIEQGRRTGRVRAIKVCSNAAHVHYAPVFVHLEDAEAQLLDALGKASPVAAAPAPFPAAAETRSPMVGVSLDVESLVVEFQALRASVAELSRGMRDLQAAIELRAESELSAIPCVRQE